MDVGLLLSVIVALGVAGVVFACLHNLMDTSADFPDGFSAHEAFLIEEIKRAEKLLGKSA